jgi:hypothetical protein
MSDFSGIDPNMHPTALARMLAVNKAQAAFSGGSLTGAMSAEGGPIGLRRSGNSSPSSASQFNVKLAKPDGRRV